MPDALTRFVLRFSDVEFPVAVYPGIAQAGLRRDTYIQAPDAPPVLARRTYVPASGDSAPAGSGEVVRMVTINDDSQPLSDEDVMRAVLGDDLRAVITQFVDLANLRDGTLITDQVFRLAPCRTLTGRVTDAALATRRAWATLLTAMRAESVAALLPTALHGQPRIAALTPDGTLLTLRYANEVVRPDALVHVEPAGRDVVAARMFIALATTPNITPPTDNSWDLVANYLARRSSEQESPVPAQPSPVPQSNLRDSILASLRGGGPAGQPLSATLGATEEATPYASMTEEPFTVRLDDMGRATQTMTTMEINVDEVRDRFTEAMRIIQPIAWPQSRRVSTSNPAPW